MSLRVLHGGAPDLESETYPTAPFDFARQPLRPGVAHEHLRLAPSAELLDEVERLAAAEGLPTGQWAAITIESERALRSATRRGGLPDQELQAALSSAAAKARAPVFSRRGRRLSGYARALRSAQPRELLPRPDGITLPVPYHSLLAWELEAIRSGAPLESWAVDQLGGPPRGRILWEAASAEAGEMLAGWIAAQAALRASC
jgi:hypothetical protein